jgi:hypothetical protein
VDIIDRDRVPGPWEMRLFGLIPAVVLGIIGAVLGRILGWQTAAVLWTIGVVISVVYYSVPGTRWMLYRAWMTATFPLGWVVSHAMLGAIYYGVLTPLGLAMRLMGRDPMNRGFDARGLSYWQRHNLGSDVRRYFRQH